jgi:DNA-binding transcriptional ArsR family regulator
MSFQAQAWAVEQVTGSPMTKAILMALANYANQDGESWYGYAKIAADAEMGESTVRKHIERLIELGLVQVERRLRENGSTQSNRYRLVMDRPGATTEHPGCYDVAGGVPRRSTLESSVEPSDESSSLQQSLIADLPTTHSAASEKTRSDPMDRFDEFWSVYPRKTAKGQARKAWPAATRKVNPEVIIKGAMRYRDDPNRTDRFTKHPATWLNGECWADEPLPVMVEQQNGNGQPGDGLTDLWRYATMRCGGCDAPIRVDTVTNQPTEPHQCAKVPAS